MLLQISSRMVLVLAIVRLSSLPLHADTSRDQLFDSDWRFFLGDVPRAENSDFDDSNWRKLDVPHDWSIEDLPPTDRGLPQLSAVSGLWRFHSGDDPFWKTPDLADGDWQEVMLPDTWERHSKHTQDNVYGWFRRRIEIPAKYREREFVLLLGKIDDVDEAWLNGERIGGSGSFPPKYETAWNSDRRYRIRAGLCRADGTDVLAVRVYDAAHDGGICAEGTEAVRIGPFDTERSPGGDSTGHTVGGIGWYRKRFLVHESSKLVSIRFDGVYMNSEAWINGHYLGSHPNGYTSFEFDLTPYLNPAGEENVLAVKVRNEGRNSRWYSGSGIYRHVYLTTTDPVHIPTGGLFVTTREVSKDKAHVRVAVEVRNATSTETNAQVQVRVFSEDSPAIDGSKKELILPAGDTRISEHSIDIPTPQLWRLESPHLYLAEVEVFVSGKSVDSVSLPFGIRKIHIDADHGVRINGKEIELYGGCVHHDNGPLGAMAIDRAEERRIELLKACGYNAIRTSHNPPSSAFLDSCDRLGMLVIVEAFDQWNESKSGNAQDYHRFFTEWHERDLASMVRRDRNHPSVIMWSIGNEIPEQFRAPDTAKKLREAVLAHDPTRPITQAICTDFGKVIQNWDKLSDPAFLNLDVAGYNYMPEKYEPDHARHPKRVMYGSESFPKDALNYWALVEEHPYVIGDFVWTAMDYIGESGIGHTRLSNQRDSFLMPWPCYNAWCGDLDICGFKKPQSHYRDVVWHRSPIEILVHEPIPSGLTEVVSQWGWPNETPSWNWSGREGQQLQVNVCSRCERVRLELNGKIIGEKAVSEDTNLKAAFDVSYEPGELRATGLVGGKVVAEKMLSTTGPPQRLKLSLDRAEIRADRNDLAYVTVEVVDAQGRRVPDAIVLVEFATHGVGELAAQGSSAPNDAASFRAPRRKTFQGRCLAILRPTGLPGAISLRAESAGLEAASVTINAH